MDLSRSPRRTGTSWASVTSPRTRGASTSETDSDAGPTLDWGIGSPGNGSDNNILAFVTSGTWHFISGVFDPAGPTEAMVVDGVKLNPSPPATIVLDPIASTIALGCRDDHALYFNGVIDEVRVYSRALSDAEIAALAQQ